MPQERLVLDGLWRCLCPSVDAATLYKTLQRPPVIRRLAPVAQIRRAASTAVHTTRENELHSDQARHLQQHPLQPEHAQEAIRRGKSRPRGGSSTKSSKNNAATDHLRFVYRRWKRRPELPFSFYSGQGAQDSELKPVSTHIIIEGLRDLSYSEGQYHAICNTVRYLVNRRHRKPDVMLYECLIRANADPKHGSATVVGSLLEEMETTGVVPTAAIFQSILEVLAVHPDYVLRNKTIEKMQAIWNPPSFNGLVSITVGLLRDGQYELALEKLEELHKSGASIPTWLYEIFIYTLGEMEVHEETLMIMQHRLRRTDAAIMHNLWHFMLDVYSRDGFYEGIKYIWRRVVMAGKLVPSDGVAINVLNAAARNDDADMATQVMKQLLSRGAKLGMHHFEVLLEIQARNNDLMRAFSTTVLMAKAGLSLDRSSTRPILAQLQNAPEQIGEALAMLRDLRKRNTVPIAAFNAVLEATLLHRGFKEGLDLYRNLQQVSAEKPDLETYTILLQHCTVQKAMRFILAEMEAFSLEPDEAIYDRVIFICTLDANYEPAFRYLEKMKATKTEGQSNDWWIGQRTALSLLKRVLAADDVRAQTLFEECKKRGILRGSGIEVVLNAAQRQQRHNREKQISMSPGNGIPHISQQLETIGSKAESATGAA